jgi:hypothetical protein
MASFWVESTIILSVFAKKFSLPVQKLNNYIIMIFVAKKI